jgi:hypothetical protein
MTPLQVAKEKGFYRLTELLLDGGLQSIRGRTSLRFAGAAEKIDLESAELLRRGMHRRNAIRRFAVAMMFGLSFPATAAEEQNEPPSFLFGG